MARQYWTLTKGRPVVQVLLRARAGRMLPRTLLADTGAGTNREGFELLLLEQDCLSCGGNPCQPVSLGGAYSGRFPVFLLQIQIPQLGFNHYLRAVGVRHSPKGMDGIACFRFLNRFTYGNFGDPGQFGLEA